MSVRRPAATLPAALAAGLLLLGCGDDSDGGSPEHTLPEVVDVITVTSTAFQEGGAIPSRYTCDDADVSPALSWTGVPGGAAATALVVDDPDAPSGTFTHWVVLDIPVDTTGVAEGGVPSGGVQAQNSAGQASYYGPCPPSGTHRYRFTLYALSSTTRLDEGVALDTALQAIGTRATGSGRLVGTYSRGG